MAWDLPWMTLVLVIFTLGSNVPRKAHLLHVNRSVTHGANHLRHKYLLIFPQPTHGWLGIFSKLPTSGMASE